MQAGPETIPGQLGPFEITGVLGRGGSGVVYRARKDGAWLALKVLASEGSITAKERGRFLREARLLGAIEHDNLVRVRECGELEDGTPYIAMELLEGTDLEQATANGAMPVARALSLFAQLASAVDALHRAGLIHRDLKPQNVMLVELGDGGERVVLLDLGIARETGAAASTTTEAGMQRGTPAYMAPERLFGASASQSSDVYELGLILYLMLVGSLPWTDAGNARARLAPASAGGLLPPRLRATILRALDPEPGLRPSSAAELVDQLRDAGELRPPRMRAAVIPLALAAVASVGAVLAWQLSPSSPSVAMNSDRHRVELPDAAPLPTARDAGPPLAMSLVAVDAAVVAVPAVGPPDARRARARRRPSLAEEPGFSGPADASLATSGKVLGPAKSRTPWPHLECTKLAKAHCDPKVPGFNLAICQSHRKMLRDWRYDLRATAPMRARIERYCTEALAKLRE